MYTFYRKVLATYELVGPYLVMGDSWGRGGEGCFSGLSLGACDQKMFSWSPHRIFISLLDPEAKALIPATQWLTLYCDPQAHTYLCVSWTVTWGQEKFPTGINKVKMKLCV